VILIIEALEQGSGNSATRRHITVLIPVSYAALWEATWERERKGAADQRGPAHQGGVGRARGGGSWELCCVVLSSWGPLYIVGRGEHLTPPPRHLGRRPRERVPAARAWLARETLTLAGLGQGCPPPFFSFFPNGLLSSNQPI
jgi:hypothetical protein